MSEIEAATPGALVLFSGGRDSTTCLAWALEHYSQVETVGFDYGQRHDVELEAAEIVLGEMGNLPPHRAERLGPHHRLDLRGFGAIGDSALTNDRAIEMTDRGLPSSFVPGRNLAFLVHAAALADRRGLTVLVGGMCETDYSGYPDCRRETMDAMETALNLGMERDFRIETPLMWLTKAQTWALAAALGGEALVDLIVKETHTCYLGERTPHDWGAGCGECPACQLRSKGWTEWNASGRPQAAS